MNFSRYRVFRSLRPGVQRRLKDSTARRILAIAAILAIGLTSAFSDSPDRLWADRTLKTLSLRDKIAQLVQIRVPGKFLNRRSEDFQAIQNDIRQNHVGGLVLFAGNIYESAVLLNDFQSISSLPLLVAGDFERGAAFRIADTTSFPWTMALGAADSEQLAYRQGFVTARESRALGVHWIFAPVMDVNNNPNNPVISIRSFGEDPELVARLGAAFIKGAKTGGVLTTAKHFPGHGDTATDSHLGIAVVPSDLARLQSLELVPFRRAIEAGVDSIMTAHVAVPNVTGEAQSPATLSSKILTGLLRDTLHFNGLVVTDALEMGGITNRFWAGLAAVRAIQAGADVLLLPPNATVAIDEVERAVKRGEISESRIDQSVRKILRAKSHLGLHRVRFVPIRRIREIVAAPENTKLAQDIADRSVTLVKDDRGLLPVDPTAYPRIFSLVLTPDLESAPAGIFQAELRQRFPLTRSLWANARISNDLLASIDKAASEADLIVCSTLIRLVSGQNAAAMPDIQRNILEKLQAARKPLIWVSFGNPYVVSIAPQIGTYLCTFSYSEVSQVAAAKAIAGEIEITGKMPVSIPGFSKSGDGRAVPKLDMSLKPASAADLASMGNGLEKCSRLLDSCIEDKIFPGAVMLVGHQGKVIFNYASGSSGFSSDSPRTSSNFIFGSGSFSVPVGVAPAAMIAADSGSLLLEVPATDYLPELEKMDIGKTGFRDLLRLTASKNGKGRGVEEEILRRILSRTTGVPMERFIAERLFVPLGMKNTAYKPATGFRRGLELSLDSRIPDFCSSAHDLSIFAQLLLNRGVYNHRRYFRFETVDAFTGSEGAWSKPLDSDWTGKIFSTKAFGKISDAGPLLWIDPARKLFIVLIANGNPDNERISEAQRKLCESVVSSLHD
ncbi:MAG TPA: glycoside hydrolase family 3 N-terminal domain-containing protein [Acidobacteriota bacterium]|nr:glycoside hydrolase family 3 N-terminal domain-containing protein [Acidobacteriota bacterium]